MIFFCFNQLIDCNYYLLGDSNQIVGINTVLLFFIVLFILSIIFMIASFSGEEVSSLPPLVASIREISTLGKFHMHFLQ